MTIREKKQTEFDTDEKKKTPPNLPKVKLDGPLPTTGKTITFPLTL